MTDSHGSRQHSLHTTDSRLPEPVRQLASPPARLWYAGDVDVLDRGIRIGIIGSRTPREDATATARRIARDAAYAGCTIVSGLAIGIDGLAHRCALDADAPTIAVVAGGLAHVHPVRNRSVAQRIAGAATPTGVRAGDHSMARGVVVSEYGAELEPAYPQRFRQRNRIIAALCDYLVVVQAHVASGSMMTATIALEQLGVPIGVVPSAPDDSCYAGSTQLIRDGADAVVDGGSLFRRLEIHGIMRRGFADAARRGARIDPADRGGWIGGDGQPQQYGLFDHPLASLITVPRTIDELADLAGLTLRDTRSMLIELEDEGAVSHTDEGTWVANDQR